MTTAAQHIDDLHPSEHTCLVMSSSEPSTNPESPPAMPSTIHWLQLWCYSGFRGCCHFHRPEHLQEKSIDLIGFLRIYSARFLLQVCGAAGAIWGASEVLTWRNPYNSDPIWRPLVLGVFLVFLNRFWWHSKHYLEREHDFPPIKHHHRRVHLLPFAQVFASQFVLEVCGAAGAIWGSSEALSLRTPSNTESWRLAAYTVGSIFAIRWVIQIFSYCLLLESYSETIQSSRIIQFLLSIEQWLAKFILEVLGAAGAVWGFSEIVLLRTRATIFIWRPIAIAVGVLFLGRWWVQLVASCPKQEDRAVTSDTASPEATADVELHDLELKENDTHEAV